MELAETQRYGITRRHLMGVSIDSRTIREGELFFAIKGDRYDGHDFVKEALRRGAIGAVVSQSWFEGNRTFTLEGKPVIPVRDTVWALQELARYYRAKFSIPVVAVTGSNGKTTTKDMIAAVLARKYQVLKTEGNLNNHLGLPLTLFGLRVEHQVAVLEMGMSGFGEIRRLCQVGDPTMGVLTNVGPAHLEFFASVEEIAEAKAELLEYLTEGRVAILNADDELVMRRQDRIGGRIITFGLERKADVRGTYLGACPGGGSKFRVSGGLEITIRLPGRHNVYNALAAVAVGRELRVAEEDIRETLERIEPSPMRMEPLRVAGVVVLNDAYNANPVSVQAALEALAEIGGNGQRIAILGDMLELGGATVQAHRRIGEKVFSLGIDYLFTYGEWSRLMGEGAVGTGMEGNRVIHFTDKEALVEKVKRLVNPGDTILVKGSRGMGLEDVVQRLREKLSG